MTTCVVLMTLFAVALGHLTLATNDHRDYRPILLQYIVIAALAVPLVVVTWRRVLLFDRILLSVSADADPWTVLASGNRG